MSRASAPGGSVGYSSSRHNAGRRFPPLLAALAVATAVAVNAPLFYILIRASGAGAERLWSSMASPLALGLLWRTVALVCGVVALAIAIALPMAWLVVRTDLPGRRFWAILGALPLVFPSYLAALALVATLGPKGHVTIWLEAVSPLRLGELSYGYSGALLALAPFTYPYIYLLLVAALRDLDPAYEESSRSLGAGRWATFFRVVLPQLRSAIYGGSLLVALYAVSDFGAVSIARYNTYTLAIYNAYRTLFDRSVAAGLALVLVLIAVILIGVEALLVRRLPPHRVRPTRRSQPIPLGRWKWPALTGFASIATLNLALPLGVLLYWGWRAVSVGNPLGSAWQPALGSLWVSALAALAACLLSIPVAVWAVRAPSRLSFVVERVSRAGFALPGIVVALSLVFFVTRYLLPLYQTLTLLVAAYVIRFLPEALAATRAAVANVSPRFEEAARSLGATSLETLRSLTVPLVRPGLLAGAGLVFLTAMKELPATLILRPTGFETLATRIWSTAAEGIYSQAALPGLVLVAVSLPATYYFVIRPVLARDRVAKVVPTALED